MRLKLPKFHVLTPYTVVLIWLEKAGPHQRHLNLLSSLFVSDFFRFSYFSFENIFEQSAATNPIVFILSPGSDPASDLLKLAERSGFGTNKVKFLSMGQGQEKVRNGSHHIDMVGAITERLERSPLAPKVQGKDSLFAGFFKNFYCSPSREWVPGSLQNQGKMKVVRKRSGTPPQLHCCRYKLAL